ncbi:cation diffusion facilitator family transporter [Hydrocarboniclastica marina]|uniref:Cation transporter n=1 Tax=Hydrocarboniclastica marina TaxID=2259620 RepID=A0A4P7XFK2_9ALTE|nr:cation diffusion facilitator family transporter [Hydrocarboniclastica marina]MAL98498.1 cation-efflux pump [Alteromonadaceae bacterium]QCF25749.1 cation transporter [Hydrocarboniclastica marina]|tara:strand:- start:2829 stop:3986 length:1158 start_codon:yes stop_codon:yes gene_type:complete
MNIRADNMRQATKVTLIGMALDGALGAAKIVIGALFNSYALIVDGIHSFSDVVSDLMVLALARMARQEPDEGHPYGHERIETFGTVLMGGVLVAVAGAIAWDSVQRMWLGGSLGIPGWPVLVVAGLSVASKEWIFRYTRRVGTRIGSDLIIANAWHSRSDAFSSIIVFAGALGAMGGFAWLDGIAAILVALIIARIGWDLAWENVKELVDTAMPANDSAEILKLARTTEGVRDVHELRTRKMGQDFLLDLHLQVAPSISVSEGHQIGVRVTENIREAFGNIKDVTFHIDPERDERGPDHLDLPGRAAVLAALKECWEPLLDFNHVGTTRLHYLDERVSVEVFLNSDEAIKPSARAMPNLRAEAIRRAEDLPWLGSVRLWITRPVP